MRCTHIIQNNGVYHNCGSCHACRINYTSSWTLRCLYELSCWDSASFCTFTYNDESLPKDYSLHPEHLTKFWKDLRYNLNSRKIKYYACGEYGDKFKRPHYHAIIFGLDCWSKDDREAVKDAWQLCDPWFFDPSGRGMLEVCREDIAYVTGYVQKKLSGVLAEQEYGDKVRPFSRCSNGLGLDFARQNSERIVKNGFTYLNGKKVGIPRYFRDKLGISQSVMIEKLSNLDIKQSEIDDMSKAFERDMKLRNLWYPENLTMMAIRFERWYDDYQFAFSRQIERDYLARKSLSNGLRRYI